MTKNFLNRDGLPKILFFDIENAPNTAYIWGLWQETTSEKMVDSTWYMLCWAAKWLGEPKIYSSSLIDFPGYYSKYPEDDAKILKTLWKLLDAADIVVAHNGKKFDVRKANARFIMNGMTPPSPYKVVDTLEAARKYFYFTSNKLDDLGKYLKVGCKLETGGFELWRQCMRGNKRAWQKMVRYCKNDILLLEKVYLKLRPYMTSHPNLVVYEDSEEEKCPKCGSTELKKRGLAYTNVGKYQKYRCVSCGGWCRGKNNLRETKVQNSN